MKKILAVLLSLMLCVGLVACSSTTTTTEPSESALKDGTYTETVKGRNEDITVETVIAEGKISSVTVTEQSETPEIAGPALEQVPAAIVKNNSLSVDTVTGATVTSEAIIEAVSKAIEEAGGDPSAFKTTGTTEETPVSGETVQLEADVVVVGAGAAGVSAALSAQNAGAKVILLEKAASVGGVSIIAGGPMAIDSKEQQEAGVAGTFTLAEVLKSWQDYNAWMDDGSLFYNIFAESADTLAFLEEHGFEFSFMGNEQAAHADGYPTYHIYKDQENKLGYYTAAIEDFKANGGEVYMETAGTKLNSANDEITGIVATASDGTTYDIKASSVILCTGGFGANADVVEEKVGFPLETFTTGTQTGDGAKMSQEIGAGVGKTIQQYHGVTSFSGIQTGSGKDEIAKAIYMPTSLWINKRAARFAPEDLNYDTALSSNAAATQGEYYFSIVSQDMVDQLAESGAQSLGVTTTVNYEPTVPLFSIEEGWTDFPAALEDGVANGTVFKGNTVEELAEAMGVDADTLKATIETYNESCTNKVDEIYGKDPQYMISLGEGPYYAVKARPVSLGGIGGVLVNSNLQVIKEDGTVIKGLYAAGNEVAEFYNNSYPLIEGVTLGSAFSGGRLCGLDAASYSLSK